MCYKGVQDDRDRWQRWSYPVELLTFSQYNRRAQPVRLWPSISMDHISPIGYKKSDFIHSFGWNNIKFREKKKRKKITLYIWLSLWCSLTPTIDFSNWTHGFTCTCDLELWFIQDSLIGVAKIELTSVGGFVRENLKQYNTITICKYHNTFFQPVYIMSKIFILKLIIIQLIFLYSVPDYCLDSLKGAIRLTILEPKTKLTNDSKKEMNIIFYCNSKIISIFQLAARPNKNSGQKITFQTSLAIPLNYIIQLSGQYLYHLYSCLCLDICV